MFSSFKEAVGFFLFIIFFLMLFCYIDSILSSMFNHFAIIIFWSDQVVRHEILNHVVFSNNKQFEV